MSNEKTYRIFLPEDDLDKFHQNMEKMLEETIIDEETLEQFQATISVSNKKKEGYEKLLIQGRGGYANGEWFVKIIDRDDEDDENDVTVFESMKMGDRRGYMLRSMMNEGQKGDDKKETMTKELERRLKRKQEVVAEILKKNK